MQVETVLAHLSIEALDERVLRRLTRLDEVQLDEVVVGPLVEHAARELRAAVAHDRARQPTASCQSLEDAIVAVDEATESGAAYFMVNCCHPDHFSHVLEDKDWSRRIHGICCNASRKSHAELDESETLDAGDPEELGGQYREIVQTMPWLNVFGGCCGSDLRHVTAIASALGRLTPA